MNYFMGNIKHVILFLQIIILTTWKMLTDNQKNSLLSLTILDDHELVTTPPALPVLFIHL